MPFTIVRAAQPRPARSCTRCLRPYLSHVFWPPRDFDKRLRRILCVVAAAVPFSGAAAQTPSPAQDALRTIDAEHIRAHLAFLADDITEGRAPGTRGGTIAAHYIASQLTRAGVEPGVRGSFFQQVPLIGWRPD